MGALSAARPGWQQEKDEGPQSSPIPSLPGFTGQTVRELGQRIYLLWYVYVDRYFYVFIHTFVHACFYSSIPALLSALKCHLWYSVVITHKLSYSFNFCFQVTIACKLKSEVCARFITKSTIIVLCDFSQFLPSNIFQLILLAFTSLSLNNRS